MGRITSYPNATTFDSAADVIIKDGTNGTKKMTIDNLAIQNAEYFCRTSANRLSRRMVYRALNLGTTFTSDQNAALAGSNPTFDNMYVGSYWTINGHKYVIADFDYWYGKYDKLKSAENTDTEAENVHHIVLIPSFTHTSQKMNDTNTTEGAYLGSKMYTENMDEVRQIIEEDWGAHIVTHREIFSNAVTDGVPSAHIWTDSRIDLMNEPMVYGHYLFSPLPVNGYNHDHYTIDRDQLAIFKLDPGFLRTSFSGWLRDVSSASYFAYASTSGNANYIYASNTFNVRPAFAIKAV